MIIINETDSIELDKIEDNEIICFLPTGFEIIDKDLLLNKITLYFEKEEQLKAIVCNYKICNIKENIEYNYFFNKNEENLPFFTRKKFIKNKTDLCLEKAIKNGGLVFHFAEPIFRMVVNVD